MRRRASAVFAVSAAALLLVAGAGPSLAIASVFDQTQEVITSDFAAAGTFAQTFTAGRSGQLTSIDLYLWSDATANVTASIAGTNASVQPSGPTVATKVVAVKAPSWYSFAFDAPPTVVAGTRYAIVLTMTSKSGGAFGSMTESYTRGKALLFQSATWVTWQTDATDFAFRTWMYVGLGTLPPPVFATATPNPTALPATVAPKPTPAKPTPVRTASPAASPTAELGSAEPSTPTPTPIDSAASAPSAIASPTEVASATVDPAPSASASASAASAIVPAANGRSGGASIALVLGAAGAFGLAGVCVGLLVLRRRQEPEDAEPTVQP